MSRPSKLPDLTLEDGPELYVEGDTSRLKRGLAFRDIERLGTCYARCSCGHTSPVTLTNRRHAEAPVGAVARALRCRWCGYKSNPWIVVRMKPCHVRPPDLRKPPHRDSPGAVSFWERYKKASRAPAAPEETPKD